MAPIFHPWLACAVLLWIAPGSNCLQLSSTETSSHDPSVSIAPWVMRAGETEDDFTHSTGSLCEGAGAEACGRVFHPSELKALTSMRHTGIPRRGSIKVAILLAGTIRDGWDGHVDAFLQSMVDPHDADVFVHASKVRAFHKSGVPDGLITRLGSSLKAWKSEEPPGIDIYPESLKRDSENAKFTASYLQFWHLEKAFDMMSEYERNTSVKYDVVVRARSDITPLPPAMLDLHGWDQPGKIHMMTDMFFWGRRDDMQPMAKFFSDGILSYFLTKYREPMERPIPVARHLDSFLVDPYVHRNSSDPIVDSHGTPLERPLHQLWKFYNKLDALPYPDMGKVGAQANLEAAVRAGIQTLSVADFAAHPPHHADFFHIKDVTVDHVAVEKEILHWALIHNFMICDVGASVNQILAKGRVNLRSLARNCD